MVSLVKSEVVIGGTPDETFNVHVKRPLLHFVIVKLSLVGHLAKLSMCMLSGICESRTVRDGSMHLW